MMEKLVSCKKVHETIKLVWPYCHNTIGTTLQQSAGCCHNTVQYIAGQLFSSWENMSTIDQGIADKVIKVMGELLLSIVEWLCKFSLATDNWPVIPLIYLLLILNTHKILTIQIAPCYVGFNLFCIFWGYIYHLLLEWSNKVISNGGWSIAH